MIYESDVRVRLYTQGHSKMASSSIRRLFRHSHVGELEVEETTTAKYHMIASLRRQPRKLLKRFLRFNLVHNFPSPLGTLPYLTVATCDSGPASVLGRPNSNLFCQRDLFFVVLQGNSRRQLRSVPTNKRTSKHTS